MEHCKFALCALVVGLVEQQQRSALLEDVVHFPKKTRPLTKVISPCLLMTTSMYHVEPHFNKTEKEKGKGPKALDSNVIQCEALVREAEDNKQLLVNSNL